MTNFPTAYDDDQSLFGDLEDIIILTLDSTAHPSGINDTETVLTFTETALVDRLNLYTELVFETANVEIVRITAKGAGGSGNVTVTRGFAGTTAQPHAAGAVATQDPIAEHFKRLRDALVAAQKFKGLTGTVLPATCEPSEVFIKTDTSEVYICFTTNVWTLFNRPDHGQYANLLSDDHALYQTEARKVTWHDALLGDHLTAPTTHDHSGGANMGSPIKKLRTGLNSNRPAASEVGELYYAEDVGNLYISPDGAIWVTYTTMPTGALFFFEGSCPLGWTREGSVDGKFLKGAPAATWVGLSSGGASNHTHEMPDLIAHAHSVTGQSGSTSENGEHSYHTFWIRDADGGSTTFWERSNYASNNVPTSSGGSHSHSFTKPAIDTLSSGQATPVSDVEDNNPPYVKLVACRKD